ncbi:hypothetical protein D3C85_1016760 [compost metagenome]
MTGEGAAEDQGLAAGRVGGGDGHGLAEADAIAGIDGGGIGGVGDVDGIARHRHIRGGAGRAIAQGKADGRIAGRRVVAVGDAMGDIVHQRRGRRGATAGVGDGQHTAAIGKGGKGQATRLQVVAADRERGAGGVEPEDVGRNGSARVLHRQAGAGPVAIAAVEQAEFGIRQRGVGAGIQHHGVADTGPGDALAAEVADGGSGVGRACITCKIIDCQPKEIGRSEPHFVNPDASKIQGRSA